MIDKSIERKQYYELVNHNKGQHLLFMTMFIVLILSTFSIMLPTIERMIEADYLQGRVVNNGDEVPYTEDDKKMLRRTNYYNNWAIDVFVDTSGEARYWFDPMVSLLMPIALFSFLISLIVSSLLPRKIGLIRHKIEREIINQLDMIYFSNNGYYSDSKNDDFEKFIENADERQLHQKAEELKINKEEIKYLKKAIKWKNESTFYKLTHPLYGLEFYLRFYFTERYGNTMLGLVYIGAAVLIIIIGMRGLKFIPSTQPSLVFFALGLEFSVLIAYAVTVMYSKIEGDESNEYNPNNKNDSQLKNSKEAENLLRALLKKPKP
jgi:hypothetical protein